MLQIKHLTKIYKTKGGAETKALDDVSIEFKEKGLVFLLGKSGSGKSTLLNLAGGLDEPTSGEVVVMGKSSKDFSGSDFDSYRNTFVGFIFQEYNILNEFTVEDNIALALELQGKKKDKEKIHSILQDVELENFAKRKPNTLSGGQKQRIAIARALIKDPQIIMADEPTGALDSATGKQVFDTLKHLSETRLVIVVSHDREFAEIYGDRIVELKDGKIISDVTKVKDAPVEQTAALVEHGPDILTIRHGAPLDGATLEAVQKFIRESEGDVILTKGEKNVENFRRVNRIDKSGATERFTKTPPQNLPERDGKQVKFIRSRLPVGKAIKIGASGLKLKPMRLFMTILLSFIAFVMFGLFSTLMFYDGEAVLKESFLQSESDYISLSKSYTIHSHNDYSGDYTYTDSARFTPAEVEKFGDNAVGVYSIEYSGNLSNLSVEGNYYKNQITKLAYIPEGHPLRDALHGKYPTGKNEIAVSSFLLESAKNGTFYSIDAEGKTDAQLSLPQSDTPENNSLVGQNIGLMQSVLKVTGVFDSGSIPSNYDSIKEENNYLIIYMYEMYLRESNHMLAFVSEEYIEEHLSELVGWNSGPSIEYFEYAKHYFEFAADENYGGSAYYSTIKAYDESDSLQLPVVKFKQFSTLENNELVVPLSDIRGYFDGKFNADREKLDTEIQENAPIQEDDETWEDFSERESTYWQQTDAQRQELQTKIDAFWRAFDILDNDVVYTEEGSRTPTAQEKAEAETYLKNAILEMVEGSIPVALQRDGAIYGDYNIVGYYLPPKDGNSGLYCSQTFYDDNKQDDYYQNQSTTNYVPEADAQYASILLPFGHGSDEYDALYAKLNKVDPDTDIVYEFQSSIYESVRQTNDLVETLSTVFLWVGVAMALFSSLLLFNFISMSISNKRKEIGILRAVGARGTDVFKIFFAESGIIVGICTVLSIVGAVVLSMVINDIIMTDAGLSVALFVYGLPSLGIMLGVALVVALISTFLPVYFAARKKPVDSIRAL